MPKLSDEDFNWTMYLPEDGDSGADNCATVGRYVDEYCDAVGDVNAAHDEQLKDESYSTAVAVDEAKDKLDEARERLKQFILDKFTPQQIEYAHERYNRAFRKQQHQH